MVPEQNRSWRAAALLIPLGFLQIVALIIGTTASLSTFGFGDVIASLSLALAFLWLFGDILEDTEWHIKISISAGIFILTGVFIVLTYGVQEFRPVKFYLLGTVSILGGLSGAGAIVRKQFNFFRLNIWLPLIIMVFMTLSMFVSHFRSIINNGMILPILLVSVIYGLIMYLIISPYLILTAFNSFYRQRMKCVISGDSDEIR